DRDQDRFVLLARLPEQNIRRLREQTEVGESQDGEAETLPELAPRFALEAPDEGGNVPFVILIGQDCSHRCPPDCRASRAWPPEARAASPARRQPSPRSPAGCRGRRARASSGTP